LQGIIDGTQESLIYKLVLTCKKHGGSKRWTALAEGSNTYRPCYA